jgi:small subunit ribosomal protein S17
MSQKKLIGKVVGVKDKTISVQFENFIKHPKYKKIVKKISKMQVHDENSTAKMGETVEVISTRPVSKTKSFKLNKVIG